MLSLVDDAFYVLLKSFQVLCLYPSPSPRPSRPAHPLLCIRRLFTVACPPLSPPISHLSSHLSSHLPSSARGALGRGDARRPPAAQPPRRRAAAAGGCTPPHCMHTGMHACQEYLAALASLHCTRPNAARRGSMRRRNVCPRLTFPDVHCRPMPMCPETCLQCLPNANAPSTRPPMHSASRRCCSGCAMRARPRRTTARS